MNEPVFVKVRNDKGEIYGSYSAYWDLVHLSSFPTCELDEVGHYGETTFIFAPDNGNVRACCEHLRHLGLPHRYILWQLEIPGVIPPVVPSYVDKQWVSDREYQRMVGENCQYVPMGGHPRFGHNAAGDTKLYDIVHMSYMYGKRAQQLQQVVEKGYSIAPVGFGAVRDLAISQSRYGLCLHQNPVPILEPLRHTMFSCFNVPLIIEQCVDPYPYLGQDFQDFLNRGPDPKLAAMAQQNYELVTGPLTFRSAVMEALHG